MKTCHQIYWPDNIIVLASYKQKTIYLFSELCSQLVGRYRVNLCNNYDSFNPAGDILPNSLNIGFDDTHLPVSCWENVNSINLHDSTKLHGKLQKSTTLCDCKGRRPDGYRGCSTDCEYILKTSTKVTWINFDDLAFPFVSRVTWLVSSFRKF